MSRPAQGYPTAIGRIGKSGLWCDASFFGKFLAECVLTNRLRGNNPTIAQVSCVTTEHTTHRFRGEWKGMDPAGENYQILILDAPDTWLTDLGLKKNEVMWQCSRAFLRSLEVEPASAPKQASAGSRKKSVDRRWDEVAVAGMRYPIVVFS